MEQFQTSITDVIKRTYNVKSFRIENNEGIEFKPGQFMKVSLKEDLYRYLSISSSPTEKGYLEFTKKITASEFSLSLEKLKAGDALTIKCPMGNFTLDESFPKTAFICGGIGITPVRSMCRYAFDKGLHMDMQLLYSNRTRQDIVFTEDLEMMGKNGVIKVAHILCEPEDGFKCRIGIIDEQVIKEEIRDYSERKFYLCGPPGMVGAMQKILIDSLHLPPGRVVTENFTGY